jgi:hypothetical protein
MSKFHNKKTIVDGILFDSQMESHYYLYLKELKEQGVVVDFKLQPVFILQEGFSKDGKRIQPIKYIADFEVTYNDGHVEIIDVKGKITEAFRIKRKILLYKYRNVDFKCVREKGRKPNKYWEVIL